MLLGTAALALLIGTTASDPPAVNARPSCELPPLDRNARTIVLRMSGGGAVSTVGIAGLNEGMTTGEIHIRPGRTKLQLFVQSGGDPVILRFSGRVDRISSVAVVAGTGAGVTGVARSKVHFVIGRKCYLPLLPAKLREALGREPDLSAEISDLYKAWTDGRRFGHQEIHGEYGRGQSKLAEKMDWLHPGGVVDMDPSKVVASGRA